MWKYEISWKALTYLDLTFGAAIYDVAVEALKERPSLADLAQLWFRYGHILTRHRIVQALRVSVSAATRADADVRRALKKHRFSVIRVHRNVAWSLTCDLSIPMRFSVAFPFLPLPLPVPLPMPLPVMSHYDFFLVCPFSHERWTQRRYTIQQLLSP